MKWERITPHCGDMVRVKVGNIYHYGVFVKDTEIIQFGFTPNASAPQKESDIAICSSDKGKFLQGGGLEVALLDEQEQKKCRTAEEIVRYARSRLGEKGYNILYNNCEHFAYECLFAEKQCTQADTVRNFFRTMPIVDVYMAKIPDTMPERSVYPKEREQEISACGNERVRREKYYAWELLQYALRRSFGCVMQTLEFTKDKSGKWQTPSAFFSISHSNGLVAVAVSRSEVGVDIEEINPDKKATFERALTEQERQEYEGVSASLQMEYLVKAWTGKESIFKTLNKNVFRPTTICVAQHSVASRTITAADKGYMLSVATEHKERIRWYLDVQL